MKENIRLIRSPQVMRQTIEQSLCDQLENDALILSCASRIDPSCSYRIEHEGGLLYARSSEQELCLGHFDKQANSADVYHVLEELQQLTQTNNLPLMLSGLSQLPQPTEPFEEPTFVVNGQWYGAQDFSKKMRIE